MKHKIYVASSWRNYYQPAIIELLRQQKHEVYDFRNPTAGNHGFAWSNIDIDWQNWNTTKYRTALRHEIAEEGFRLDMDALDWADVVVLLLPSGRSSHVEAAYHCGKGKPVIVHMPEPCEPELMYKMFSAITVTNMELIGQLDVHISQLHELGLAR